MKKELAKMLSVIIPCYNGAETIGLQLKAFASQQWSEPWEIIVADNRSTDHTRAIVKNFQEQLPNLRLIDAFDRQGQPHALNVGVQAAKGDRLAFCDADDEIGPGWVAAMGNALSQYDLVAGRLDAEKLNEKWLQQSRQCPQQQGLQQYDYPPFLPHAAGCNFGVKRTIYDAIGAFDDSLPYLHDTDFIWRVQLGGTPIHFVPDAIVHYRYRDTFSGIYRQAVNYAEYNVILYKRYRSQGMPMLTVRAGILKKWKRIFKDLFGVRDKTSYARWLWMFGWQIGRLKGSLKHRVYAL
jgi:glycosyltransferase involved in cell wall biosynthesis